jgi:putative peptide zinc metalloprotease protein
MANSGLRHPDWYLISEQRFRRRAAIRAVPQTFRGEGFVVLSDKLSGQNLRLTARAEQVWHSIDGRRTVQDLWADLMAHSASAPTQGEMVEWIMTLVSSGLILSDHDLDPKHLTDRAVKKRSQQIEAKAASPLSIKVPLLDPGNFIRTTFPVVAPLFTQAGGLLVICILLAGLVTAGLNLPALLSTADQGLLSQSGVVALLLAYPVMKALHEMAHAYTVHHFGGEVREAGVMLLIFFPVPYVDASEASAFAARQARMLVGAAGILTELVIAALALIAWSMIEPGVERAVLFSFVVMGTLSTLLFNGNPLLKFDAYYVLADWLELPNLATRSGAYLSDRFLSRVLGLRAEVLPDPAEARIFLIYGVLSLWYRLFLTLVISLVVSQIFFALGVALALWAIFSSVLWPLVKLARKGAGMARGQDRQRRAFWRLAGLVVAVGGVGGLVPLPFSAAGYGQIVGLPVAELRIGSAGMITQPIAPDGMQVAVGEALLKVVNPEQTARQHALQMSAAVQSDNLLRGGLDLPDRQQIARDLVLLQTALRDVTVLEDARTLRAGFAGRLVWVDGAPPKPGSHVARGDALGHIVTPKAIEIVVSFSAAFAGIVPASGAAAELRLPDGRVLSDRIDRVRVLDAGAQVPEALLVSNGGRVPEMSDAPGRALAPTLVAWISPDADLSAAIGQRVEARIVLPPAPLFQQVAFHLRRLFLRVTRV